MKSEAIRVLDANSNGQEGCRLEEVFGDYFHGYP